MQRVQLSWKPSDLRDFLVIFRRRNAGKEECIEDPKGRVVGEGERQSQTSIFFGVAVGDRIYPVSARVSTLSGWGPSMVLEIDVRSVRLACFDV